MSEQPVEYVDSGSVDLTPFITALVKHLGEQRVPVDVFASLDHTEDLLGIDFDVDAKEIVFHLVDPDEVTFDEPNAE